MIVEVLRARMFMMRGHNFQDKLWNNCLLIFNRFRMPLGLHVGSHFCTFSSHIFCRFQALEKCTFFFRKVDSAQLPLSFWEIRGEPESFPELPTGLPSSPIRHSELAQDPSWLMFSRNEMYSKSAKPQKTAWSALLKMKKVWSPKKMLRRSSDKAKSHFLTTSS